MHILAVHCHLCPWGTKGGFYAEINQIFNRILAGKINCPLLGLNFCPPTFVISLQWSYWFSNQLCKWLLQFGYIPNYQHYYPDLYE